MTREHPLFPPCVILIRHVRSAKEKSIFPDRCFRPTVPTVLARYPGHSSKVRSIKGDVTDNVFVFVPPAGLPDESRGL